MLCTGGIWSSEGLLDPVKKGRDLVLVAIHRCKTVGLRSGLGVCHVCGIRHGKLDGMEAGEFSVLVVWYRESELGGVSVPPGYFPVVPPVVNLSRGGGWFQLFTSGSLV